MACLSIATLGRLPLVKAANPIFTLREVINYAKGGSIVFEVLEADAEVLKSLINKPSQYAFNSQSFSGTLTSLDSCESTHPGLGHIRHKPTLRGTLTVLPEASTAH
jgi:hypothetical protein